MATKMTDHPIPEDDRNDPGHPIPNLNVIDVVGYKKEGGADLCVVVASPLAADAESQTRLLDKLEGYLGYIQSGEFLDDSGAPANPENTTINVLLHPDSADAVRELLCRCQQWVNQGGASLVVRNLSSEELGYD